MNLSTWFELIEHWLMLIGIFAKQDKYPPLWNLVLVSPFVPKDIWVLWIETPCTSRYKYSESHWLINPETESDEQDVHDIEGELNVLQSWNNRWYHVLQAHLYWIFYDAGESLMMTMSVMMLMLIDAGEHSGGRSLLMEASSTVQCATTDPTRGDDDKVRCSFYP